MVALSQSFKRNVGAMLVIPALTLAAFPLAASAQDNTAPVHTVAMATTQTQQPTNVSFDNVTIIPEAHTAAAAWVVGHPERMAVPIRLGLDTMVAPERVERKLREDFQSHNVTNVRFFYEVGGRGESMVGYVSDKYVSPTTYPLETARDHVQAAAEGMLGNNQTAIDVAFLSR